MSSGGVVDRETVTAALDALDAAVDRLVELNFDALTTPEWLALVERCEKVRRRLPVAEHQLINHLARQASAEELGGKLSHAIADWALISRTEAARRIKAAADLGPRRGLTGEPIAPVLAGAAAAQRDGKLGGESIQVIRRFYHQLPAWIDQATRERAEAQLARQGSQFRPEQLAGLAATIADCLNPDGIYRDEDRARRRGLTLGNQQSDGMSELRGLITPELRATLEAVLAKLAAPGMGNPESQTLSVDGTPSQEAIDTDTRSAPQRNHDALTAGLRALLASGELGRHNGLPASIIVTTTLAELEAAAGQGLTGAGTILPMSDVIRLARHARHYLAVFDKGKALALYHSKRLAAPGQRIVLYARDRGCSASGCDVTGYFCEVHHVVPYAQSPTTDVNQLTFACSGHHPPADKGWTTRKNTTATANGHPHPPRSRPTPHQHAPPQKTPPHRRRRGCCGIPVIVQLAKLCHREG